ncbi:MAG: glycosyltransferase family 1 protein [Acidimicrobiales bacterium]
MMRVAVNLLWLRPGAVGGTETYIVRLLEALRGRDDVAPILYCAPDVVDAHPSLEVFDARLSPPVTGSRPARVALESTWLAGRLRRDRPDVVHHPGGMIPAGAPGPSMVTIHDLQPLTSPERFGIAKVAWLGQMLPRSARRASLVSAPSSHTAAVITRVLGIDDVAVVPSTPGEIGPRPAPDVVAAALTRLGVGQPFVLYPAITYRHKNHAVLVAALAVARNSDLTVVFCGGVGDAESDIDAAARRHGVSERVHRLGRVDADDLEALYAAAVALAFPSWHEGFGLPVAEAFARRCAVVAANATALPEVVGDAGLLIDPHDADAWAEALDSLTNDGIRRSALAQRGLERAAQWAPEASADRLVAAYRRTAGGAR